MDKNKLKESVEMNDYKLLKKELEILENKYEPTN
jgi:hypothetical protein